MTSILTYHRVGPYQAPSVHRGMHCTVPTFRRHLVTLRRFGFRVAGLEEAVHSVRTRTSLSSRTVILTFDDGFRDFYDYALPLLREFRFPAALFVVSAKLGGAADWTVDAGFGPPPLLDAQALREISGSGVEIGSHTRTHPRLSDLDDAALVDELLRSRQELEQTLSRPVRFLAYPFGDHDSRVRNAAQAAGYEAAMTTHRAVLSRAPGLFEIPRKGVGFGLGGPALLWKLLKRGRRPGDHHYSKRTKS